MVENASAIGPLKERPLRLWPGIAAATLLVVVKFVAPLVSPDALPVSLLGGLGLSVVIMMWWTFFSRAPVGERLVSIALIAAMVVAIRPALHVSIAEAGMGFLFPIMALPYTALALVVCAVMGRRLTTGRRRSRIVASVVVSIAVWTVVRTGGLNHDGASAFAWRWTASAEERLLATGDDEDGAPAAPERVDGPPEWPGFRGRGRDGVCRGVRLATEWATTPPVERWRRPVGPGWSSFAVIGTRLFTQEQRGEAEIVACYDANTGKACWKHRDATRFWESNAGAGPRGTPTIDRGHVFALGGTGIVNALDAATGRRLWSRNAAADTKTNVPTWGFAGSPLVVGDLVVVAASGSLIAYDRRTGAIRWSRPKRGDAYSSPHLARLAGVEQIVLQHAQGVFAVSLDGEPLWDYAWPGMPIVQPSIVGERQILVSVGERSGIRRLDVTPSETGWHVTERWTSKRLKPYFNDSIVHKGHVYGFTGRSMACLELETGRTKWRGGRYGRGQLVALADQDLLLVLTDKGELALVRATPERHTELARVPVLEGKTWNHPVLVGDVLFVRNAEEMAAFRLPRAPSSNS